MSSQQINHNKAGLGIRAELFEPVLNEKPELSFLEAHSENYFGDSIARAKLLEPVSYTHLRSPRDRG